jgi:hypothetical protein
MLHSLIFWLQSRKLINLALVFAYFIFILFMHNPLVHLSIWVEKILSPDTYNSVVALIFLSVLLLLSFFVLKKLAADKKNQKLKLFYLISTVAAIIIHSRFMFDSNIEVIHSFEFTILAFLLFPLTKRFGAAILFTLPFMLFDEWYQYIILYPDWNDYFDLNDIMMDTYGCGLAITALMIAGVKGNENIKPVWQRPEFISLVCLVVAVLVAVNFCLITAYASEACGNTWLVMNERLTPEPFLRAHPTRHIFYHVMKPLEALVAIATLHLFYFGLDSFRKP